MLGDNLPRLALGTGNPGVLAGREGMATLRITAASDKVPEPSLLMDHGLATERAGLFDLFKHSDPHGPVGGHY